MSYYLGLAIKLVPILIGWIFMIKLILISEDKEKMKKLDENLTPLAKFKMVVFFAPALLMAATMAMLIGDYSDSLMNNSELGQEQAKDKNQDHKK